MRRTIFFAACFGLCLLTVRPLPAWQDVIPDPETPVPSTAEQPDDALPGAETDEADETEQPPATCRPEKKPELFVKLPEICPTPDGMAIDQQGNIILACPNYADQTHPAVLMKIDRENRVRLFMKVPVHPDTGVACPMGIDFAPNGDLYIADNQGWVKPNNKGRILRVQFRNERPYRVSVVAYGMSHPNGVKVYGDSIYVTQSLLVQEEDQPLISGVYRFALDDEAVKVSNTLEDQDSNLLIATFQTLNPECQYGADGLAFDSEGNLFVGNFGDGTLHKIVFDNQGKVLSNTIFNKPDPCMKSIDGIAIDKNDNVYVADFSNNAICVVTPEAAVRVLAQSPDCDGSRGGLDQPGEPLLLGDDVIVSNFDMVTGPDKRNTKHDAPYTLSIIRGGVVGSAAVVEPLDESDEEAMDEETPGGGLTPVRPGPIRPSDQLVPETDETAPSDEMDQTNPTEEFKEAGESEEAEPDAKPLVDPPLPPF